MIEKIHLGLGVNHIFVITKDVRRMDPQIRTR